LCDVGTLGGASTKLDALDLSLLTRYLAVLIIHDDDQAGEQGRQYVAELHTRFPRMQSIQPPAHDLTDFWKAGGDLRAWLAGQVARVLGSALGQLAIHSPVTEGWSRLAELAASESH
jgi:hypothetical protein